MTPISSMNQFLVIDRHLQFNSLERTRAFENTQKSVFDNIQQTPAVPTEFDLINQLPHDLIGEVTRIFRSINILANQALELGQDFGNRENLQTEVDENISEVRSVLDDFTQDDLILFIAISQNQIPRGFIGFGSTSTNSVFDLSFNGISDNSLESLLNINVLSESGALIALDLTGNIIDKFTGNNNSSILESFLDDLTASFIGSTIFTSLQLVQESEETKPSSDTDTEEPIIPIPPINPLDSNPPTIIELAGYWIDRHATNLFHPLPYYFKLKNVVSQLHKK